MSSLQKVCDKILVPLGIYPVRNFGWSTQGKLAATITLPSCYMAMCNSLYACHVVLLSSVLLIFFCLSSLSIQFNCSGGFFSQSFYIYLLCIHGVIVVIIVNVVKLSIILLIYCSMASFGYLRETNIFARL